MANEHKKRKSKLVTNNRSKVDAMLDGLDARIEELRVQYEQYFIDLIPQPPDEMHKAVRLLIKQMLKTPFKNSSTRFRMQSIITRYQTYNTYWERVKKQREDGTYVKDVFRAELHERENLETKEQASAEGRAERGLKQLFGAYEAAIRKVGGTADQLNFDNFKKSLIDTAKTLRERHGITKLSYKIVVKDGKVVVKASAKD